MKLTWMQREVVEQLGWPVLGVIVMVILLLILRREWYGSKE